MRERTISIPMLHSPLENNRRTQQNEGKEWQDHIATEWATMGKPTFNTIRIMLIFSLTDKSSFALVDSLASGSKLVGQAIKGLFVPDISPEHLTEWRFCCDIGNDPRTTILIEDVSGQYEKWQRPSCAHYEICNTPLCPLDQISLSGSWYPDEEICRAKTQGSIPWIKAQKKIAASGARPDRYFTLAMLNRNCIIRQGLMGLDPDQEDGLQIRKWMSEHPEKREMSEEEILMRKKLAQKCLNREGDRGASEGVSTPFSKPPLNRVLGQKKCP